MTTTDDGARRMLRHTLATLAYRGGKALRGAPDGFATFDACAGARTPGQILAHLGDLFDWACALADGKHVWHNAQPLPWEAEVARFFAALERFDRRLADASRSASRPRGSSRAPWPTRSPTSARSRCCGAWPAPPSAPRTTSRPTSRPAASARTKRRREVEFD